MVPFANIDAWLSSIDQRLDRIAESIAEQRQLNEQCMNPTWFCPEMQALRLEVDMLSRTVEGMLPLFPKLMQIIMQVAHFLSRGKLPSATGA